MEEPGTIESFPLKIPGRLLKVKSKEMLPKSTQFPDSVSFSDRISFPENVSFPDNISFPDSIQFQESISFPQILLDYIPSPIFQRDRNGIYVNCNEKFARQIMGLPKERLIGNSFLEFQKLLPDSFKESYRRHDRKLLREEGNQQYETEVLCADGVKRNFFSTRPPIKTVSGTWQELQE